MEEGGLLFSSSDADLLQQLLDAAVSKQASTAGSGNVTLILQSTPQQIIHIASRYPRQAINETSHHPS